MTQPVTFDERGVDREVAAGRVLDEEGDIRRLIEKFFQQRSVNRGRGFWHRRGGVLGCACFHVSKAF